MKLVDWKCHAFVLWPCGDKTIHEVICVETTIIPSIFCLKTDYGTIWRECKDIEFFYYTPDRLCGEAGFSNGWNGKGERGICQTTRKETK